MLFSQYYVSSSRELKRLDSISRSPVYAHFSETLAGVTTIRAFGKESQFIADNQTQLDNNQRVMLSTSFVDLPLFSVLTVFLSSMQAFFCSTISNRWLSVRVEFIGACVVTLAAFFAVLERDNIDPGLAGLSITYALSVTSTLTWYIPTYHFIMHQRVNFLQACVVK